MRLHSNAKTTPYNRELMVRRVLQQQSLEYVAVDCRQPGQVGGQYFLVDLVDGRVDRPQFNHLDTVGGDEAAVRGAAGRG